MSIPADTPAEVEHGFEGNDRVADTVGAVTGVRAVKKSPRIESVGFGCVGLNVVVYYSGHGVPGPGGERGYLLPVNADPDAPEINGYPIDLLLANLARLEMRIVFEALVERGVEVDRRGKVDYMLSSFTNSLKRMPVQLRASR